MRTVLRIFLAVVCIFVCSGCFTLVVGGAAAGGAIIVMNDSVKTAVDTSYSRAWKVSNAQIKKLGKITKSFEKIGEIKAIVEGASVAVKIKKLTERTMEIKISAHKNILADLDLAQAILTSILREL